MIDETDKSLSLKQFQPTIEIHGPIAVHNMCCAVYNHLPAVYDLSTGIFHPSREANRDGYLLIRIKNKFIRLVVDYLIGSN